jgi:cell wall-associated NlpC family hydrolase
MGIRDGRWRRGAAVLLTAGAVLATAVPVFAAPTATPTTRIAGDDRYATAAAVSAVTYPTGVPVAYVATGEGFADALAGGPAAAKGRGPMLLTSAGALPDATATELARLAPEKIVVLGGPSSVADAVVAALGDIAPTSRIAGDDRYATAAAVSAATFAAKVPVAYIATGEGFADALAGGPAAAKGGGPMLLTTSASLPDATKAELQRLLPKRIVVLGGPSSVAAEVLTALKSIAPTTRIAGDTRYATAAAISAAAFPTGVAHAFVATGEGFADALAGGPAAARASAPMILTPPSGPPTAVVTEVGRLLPGALVVIGGAATVPDAAVAGVVGATGAALPDPSPKAALAVATAKAQLGKPYLYGSAGPDSFDCSGLVMFAWKAAGVNLPHQSGMQQDLLPYVPVGLLAPGDLVFYGSPAHHVGMYVGDGQMVEAPKTGVPVRLASINRADFTGGGRPT